MNGIVTVSCLGGFGRFGNQLFQYAFARAYAESIGAELVIPPTWIGKEVFKNVKERTGLPPSNFERTESPGGRTNIDLFGYFQKEEHVSLLSRGKIREWLQPSEKYSGKKGHDLVFHQRRGDYINNSYYAIVSHASYEKAARNFGYDPSIAKIYSDETRREADQYDDFFEIVASRAIFRANSTYSFWAGVLTEGKVYSPVVEDRTGWIDCDFIPGNSSKLMCLFKDLNIKE